MNTNFQKIQQIIEQSGLPPIDKEELVALFAKANDQDLSQIVDLFIKDAEWVYEISANYKAKYAALTTGNKVLWQSILDEEEFELKKIAD